MLWLSVFFFIFILYQIDEETWRFCWFKNFSASVSWDIIASTVSSHLSLWNFRFLYFQPFHCVSYVFWTLCIFLFYFSPCDSVWVLSADLYSATSNLLLNPSTELLTLLVRLRFSLLDFHLILMSEIRVLWWNSLCFISFLELQIF